MPTDLSEARLAGGRFALAVAISVGVILSAPFTGEARRWLRLTFPGHFVPIVGGAVGVAALLVVGVAIARIRTHRAVRYGLVAAAVAVAVAYSAWSALGNPESDVVEHVHFFEYGLVAWLFYRAWLPFGNVSVLVLAFLAAFTVGTCDEAFQWFIPGRVGEARDVLLDGAVIVSGLLFSSAVRPIDRLGGPWRARHWQHVSVTAAVVVAAFAVFLDCVHRGYEIVDAEAGTFRSIFTAQDLDALARDRTARWAINPPLTRPPSLSREDQYMSEGLLHVQARNRAWDAGDFAAAWFENRILERYFAAVLDTPSYVSRSGHRWPPAQRLEAERRYGRPAGGPVTFVSRAQGEFPIFTWSKTAFRSGSAAAVFGLMFTAAAARRRRFAQALPR